jgi:hypothetical protein
MKYLGSRLRRRDFVRLLGGAAFALPCLELFGGDVRAQAAGKAAKFAVFCYTPNGVNQNAFWPTGGETDFILSPILTPLSAYRDKMLILGPQLSGGAVQGGSGLAYAGNTPQHQAPVCLTGRVGGPLPYGNQATAVNKIDGPSIDQVIAKAVGQDTLFSSLNFGLHPVGGDTPSDINFAEDGSPLKRMATPDEAYGRVFGMPVGQPTDSGIEQRRQAAISTFLHERFATLRPTLSAHDQGVLDAHLTSLRSYEEQLKRRTQSTCEQPARQPVPTDDDAVRTGADSEMLSPFFMDIIASAFSCDLSRVASVTFGYPGGGDAGGLRMPWLGFTDPLHAVSHHGGNAATLDKYAKMHTWIAEQIAHLMARLAAMTDASGQTLLDQTVIYWFNRHGDGDAHSNFALPNVLLGGAGGYFRMGRFLQLPKTSPTAVLISIANAMGVDVPSFGKDAFTATSGLGGLSA